MLPLWWLHIDIERKGHSPISYTPKTPSLVRIQSEFSLSLPLPSVSYRAFNIPEIRNQRIGQKCHKNHINQKTESAYEDGIHLLLLYWKNCLLAPPNEINRLSWFFKSVFLGSCSVFLKLRGSFFLVQSRGSSRGDSWIDSQMLVETQWRWCWKAKIKI